LASYGGKDTNENIKVPSVFKNNFQALNRCKGLHFLSVLIEAYFWPPMEANIQPKDQTKKRY
jgi:hypothetical protein